RFLNARSLLVAEGGSAERDFMVRDTALSLIDLGGEKAEIDKGARLKWDETAKEVRQVLQNLRSTEGRTDTLREVTRKLIALGKQHPVVPLIPRPKNKDDREADPAVRIGFAEGFALKGDWEGARRHARQPGSPAARLDASLAIAAVAVDTQQPDAGRPDLEE